MRPGLWLVTVCICATLAACSSQTVEEEDLGSFLPEDTAQGESDTYINYGTEDWSTLCKPDEVSKDYHWLFVGAQLYKNTTEHPVKGEPMVGIRIEFRDLCDDVFHEGITGEDGTYGFQLKIDDPGFDGYFQYSEEGGPLFRSFDKRFGGFVQVNKIRMFDGLLFDSPLVIVGQNNNLGFLQGTVYNLVDEKTVPGVVITATTNGQPNGDIGYLADDLPIPNMALTETKGQGVFFVVNAQPGQIVIHAVLPDGRTFDRPAKVWAVNSNPSKTITQVGLPVYPDYDGAVTPDW